ncbi:3-hydroxyacyl-CoA dehydrogenase family protein [Holdemanella porci]|jgi:3-hydroxybutyryl-CoA dehydrogenase|uniref:3-hydroxyacyl-CoA dehydrogenase family protein n=1 Tax=Holdemanella TaxID=1573535 RepID=UPI002A92B797|nr:3-hydroxyacyl-CoA dehydrogenase NAD-binding domain-containing protein [Holdemanella sp.]MDY5474122.1 3-hydroxyacyl-CoA dehydrogenase NAD-binding domain-containing protein [Holdemanella porci]MEE0079137.1 3-hydroxyacyl-CoA dehydrogenase NAD-binding domain-containing protein [Holdemanella sp.]
MKNVGVIGAGTMGQGIANAFATAGYNVTVCDIKIEWAQNGINKIGAKLDKLVSREKMTAEKAEGIKANLTAGEYKDLADCDLIVEAVLEKMEIKKDLFKTLDEICKEDCIFGTNTSSLSVTEIANGIKHNVIGMHFFNPADRMKLVEVISGENTPVETKEAIIEYSKSLGKTPVEVAEGPGFVVNRILIPMINEACFIYQEGLASVEDIDTAMKLGANHPMGPLALGDLIGLDIVLDVMEVLYTETGDPKYRPCTLLKKMVRAGKLGQKTKQGFYSYN